MVDVRHNLQRYARMLGVPILGPSDGRAYTTWAGYIDDAMRYYRSSNRLGVEFTVALARVIAKRAMKRRASEGLIHD